MIKIEKGVASVNVTEPYLVPVHDEVKDALLGTAIKNMLVIDTTQEFNKKKFEEYQTFALLTKDEIVTQSDKGQITIQELRAMPNAVINQEVLLGWVEKIRNALVYMVPVGVVVTYIVLLFGYVIYLVPLLLFALIPFALAWMKKIPLSYAGAYKMSVYAVMPGLVLKTLLNIGGFLFVPPYLSLLTFALVIFINMRELKQPTLFKDNK